MANLLMKRHEFYLASFPFGDKPGMKLRPVVTLTSSLGTVPEALVAYVSSVIPKQLLDTDIIIDPTLVEFASTNLKTTSVLRLHKLATIHVSSIVRKLGTCPASLSTEIEEKLRKMLF